MKLVYDGKLFREAINSRLQCKYFPPEGSIGAKYIASHENMVRQYESVIEKHPDSKYFIYFFLDVQPISGEENEGRYNLELMKMRVGIEKE